MEFGFGKVWSHLGSITASIMFVYTIYERFFPPHLRTYVRKYAYKFTSLISPYINVTFPESSGKRLKRCNAYANILTYLNENTSQSAKRLKAEVVQDSQTPVVLSMDDGEEITDEFQGVKVWWFSKYTTRAPIFSLYPAPDEKRCLTLTFHRRHRDLITGSYIKYVLEEGKAISIKNRQLKLYTNKRSKDWPSRRNSTGWRHVLFEHPARFATLAMDPKKKEEIINDLVKFKNGKDYYEQIGKAWKRGYLLYGPPGTGKSTMIAAMANFMNYDVYDLELTAVKDNTELKELLIDTSNKSIIVIEDIDCSLDLTGQRKTKEEEKDEEEKAKDATKKSRGKEEGSKVTLSGLLNFIDGIWSACGGERIIIFTTNFVEKLDPALIRRGRMDKHIELSYCTFEAFKVLAKNYLKVESHSLFPIIEEKLEETDITPADVAENLMPKSIAEDSDTCLQNLVKSLDVAKEGAKKKAEEEAKKKAGDEEAKLKEEKEQEEGAKEEEVKANEKTGGVVKENGVID